MHGKTYADEHDGRGVFEGGSRSRSKRRGTTRSTRRRRASFQPSVARNQRVDGEGGNLGLRHRTHNGYRGRVQLTRETMLTIEGKKLLANWVERGSHERSRSHGGERRCSPQSGRRLASGEPLTPGEVRADVRSDFRRLVDERSSRRVRRRRFICIRGEIGTIGTKSSPPRRRPFENAMTRRRARSQSGPRHVRNRRGRSRHHEHLDRGRDCGSSLRRPVAKHGNRSVSSTAETPTSWRRSASVRQFPPCRSAHCASAGLRSFRAANHPAKSTAAPVRRELGIRTVFNALGPLMNPAGRNPSSSALRGTRSRTVGRGPAALGAKPAR